MLVSNLSRASATIKYCRLRFFQQKDVCTRQVHFQCVLVAMFCFLLARVEKSFPVIFYGIHLATCQDGFMSQEFDVRRTWESLDNSLLLACLAQGVSSDQTANGVHSQLQVVKRVARHDGLVQVAAQGTRKIEGVISMLVFRFQDEHLGPAGSQVVAYAYKLVESDVQYLRPRNHA